MTLEVFCKKPGLPFDPTWVVSTKTQNLSLVDRVSVEFSPGVVQVQSVTKMVLGFF